MVALDKTTLNKLTEISKKIGRLADDTGRIADALEKPQIRANVDSMELSLGETVEIMDNFEKKHREMSELEEFSGDADGIDYKPKYEKLKAALEELHCAGREARTNER